MGNDDPGYHRSLGVAFAGLGRKQEAIREGMAAVELMPILLTSLCLGSISLVRRGGAYILSPLRFLAIGQPKSPADGLWNTGDSPSLRYNSQHMIEVLPGSEYIVEGIEDLKRGTESVAALLVSIGARRLRRIGLDVPDNTPPSPEHRLYELLQRQYADAAHSRYNALIRRLVSFERAAECVK